MTQKKKREMKTFGVIWLDYDNAFGEKIFPITTEKEKDLFRFPDAILIAENGKIAKLMVKKINEKYKNTLREDIPSVFRQDEVLKSS
jgi:hypothetical protein